MKKFIYFLAALMAISVTSCKDDDVTFNSVNDLDRLPMPMFRKKDNTNVDETTEQYGCRVMDKAPNSIQLYWYGVEGAKEYEIRYAPGLTSGLETDWQNPSRNVVNVTVPADQLYYFIDGLEYSTDYRFCIRAIHPTDPAKNSLWYGMGGGREWEDYLGITTGERYATPFVVDTRDKDYHGFTVYIDLNYNRNDYIDSSTGLDTDAKEIEKRFQLGPDGRFVATHLTIRASSINPDATVPAEYENFDLKNVTFVDGKAQIPVTGLDESSLYLVALRDETNPKAEYDVDKFYNYATIRTNGDPGADILIPHKWAKTEAEMVNVEKDDLTQNSAYLEGEIRFEACRLDTVIDKFTSDNTLAEGQTFLLEGGKAYYIRGNQGICKGFTLKTDPKDILAGKGRAKLYMGGVARIGDVTQTSCWIFGKMKETGDFDVPIKVDRVIFQDLDVASPLQVNFGMTSVDNAGTNTASQYFINMYGTGLGVEFEGLEVRNCTFQNINRGFIRTQGNKAKSFNHVIVDNCVFFNMGYYDNGGGGFNYFHAGDENDADNLFNDLVFTNNTIYDSPMGSLIRQGRSAKNWANTLTMNVRFENNTFINLNTRGATVMFDTRNWPGGSSFTFKRNLIVLAADVNDNRALNQASIDIRNIEGSGLFSIDFSDNYSAGCRDNHLVDDGIFQNGTPFSGTQRQFGNAQFADSYVNGTTRDNLIVRVGETPLRADELFTDPNPSYHATIGADNNAKMHWIDPDQIWSRLQYKNDLKVITHEIYTKNIGDQRWKTADPKWFYPAGAPVPEVTTPETPAE